MDDPVPRALISLCLLIGVSGLGVEQSLVVAVPSDVSGDYRRWLGGRDVAAVDPYLGEGVRRDVVEVALFGQALALGCGDVTVDRGEVDSAPRILLLSESSMLMPLPQPYGAVI